MLLLIVLVAYIWYENTTKQATDHEKEGNKKRRDRRNKWKRRTQSKTNDSSSVYTVDVLNNVMQEDRKGKAASRTTYRAEQEYRCLLHEQNNTKEITNCCFADKNKNTTTKQKKITGIKAVGREIREQTKQLPVVPTTQLAKMGIIDPKFVDHTADVLITFFWKNKKKIEKKDDSIKVITTSTTVLSLSRSSNRTQVYFMIKMKIHSIESAVRWKILSKLIIFARCVLCSDRAYYWVCPHY